MHDSDPDHHIEQELAIEMTSEAVNRAWASVMDRGRDLLPLFDGCDLGLTITVAAHALGLRALLVTTRRPRLSGRSVP